MNGAYSNIWYNAALTSFFSRANLSIVKELGDRAAQGRTYGNLGNTQYLLGNFENAVVAHEQVRLPVRRNLIECCKHCIVKIKLNKYEIFGFFYFLHSQRLLIAKEFGDRAAERRAYCNLGNAYIFLGQFEVAAENYKQV